MRTLNVSDKMRYGVIKSMHIGVKLLYDHGGIADQDVIKGLLIPTVNDSG